CARPGTPFDFW
nr:immunoglobulin heavy chain junction region [Mus musculus]